MLKQQDRHEDCDVEIVVIRIPNTATAKEKGLVIREVVTLDAALISKDSIIITIFHDRELTSLFLYNELEQWKSVVK